MRVFVAIEIDPAIRARVQRFMDGVREFAPSARWVRPESLHLTLKFIGEKPPDAVEQIKRELATILAPQFEISISGYGFFPTPKAARVFWVGIQSGHELTQLAKAVDDATARLGVPEEEHPYKPHLTLARGPGGSGSPYRTPEDRDTRNFHKIQAKLAVLPVPEFGTMRASEFRLYQSELLRGGARYTPLRSFVLQATAPVSSEPSTKP
jgi:2'-5' RNA ligase